MAPPSDATNLLLQEILEESRATRADVRDLKDRVTALETDSARTLALTAKVTRLEEERAARELDSAKMGGMLSGGRMILALGATVLTAVGAVVGAMVSWMWPYVASDPVSMPPQIAQPHRPRLDVQPAAAEGARDVAH